MGACKLNTPIFRIVSSGSRLIITPDAKPQQRATFFDSESCEWQAVAKSRLEELIRLKEGWDGYSAFPVSFDNAMFAYQMLDSIARPETPAPQIVPGPSGDLQIEWHLAQGDIELWVRGPNNVHAWRSTDDGEDEEIDLSTDFATVAEWLKEITSTEPTIAIAAAA